MAFISFKFLYYTFELKGKKSILFFFPPRICLMFQSKKKKQGGKDVHSFILHVGASSRATHMMQSLSFNLAVQHWYYAVCSGSLFGWRSQAPGYFILSWEKNTIWKVTVRKLWNSELNDARRRVYKEMIKSHCVKEAKFLFLLSVLAFLQ